MMGSAVLFSAGLPGTCPPGGGTGDTGSGTFRLTADPDWDAVNEYTF